MIKLISIELRKIFYKKSIFLMFGLIIIFCFLNNILYRIDYDNDGNYKYTARNDIKVEEKELEEELKKYDFQKSNEFSMYLAVKTKLDLIKLKKQYANTSWQYYKINDYLYDLIYKLNEYHYGKEKDENFLQLELEYKFLLDKINNDDWEYFLSKERDVLVKKQLELNEQLKKKADIKQQLVLKEQLDEIDFQLKVLMFRLTDKIKYDSSYLNVLLENYQDNYKIVSKYKKINRDHEQEFLYRVALSDMKVSEYILKHKKNINKQNNLSYQLRTIVSDYELFIVLLILIVSSTILTDEFRDGTIKLLLIKPYSRGKILLGKYLSVVIFMGITILFLIVIQLLIGGIIFGMDSLKLPVVAYHFELGKTVEYSIFSYMMIQILAKIPFLLMMITIAIVLGVLTNSSVLAMIFPLTLYLFNSSLSSLCIKYKLEFMKYLVNINWNLNDYLFGGISDNPYISFKFSIVILISYFFVLWVLTFICFKRKDIKNI